MHSKCNTAFLRERQWRFYLNFGTFWITNSRNTLHLLHAHLNTKEAANKKKYSSDGSWHTAMLFVSAYFHCQYPVNTVLWMLLPITSYNDLHPVDFQGDANVPDYWDVMATNTQCQLFPLQQKTPEYDDVEQRFRATCRNKILKVLKSVFTIFQMTICHWPV